MFLLLLILFGNVWIFKIITHNFVIAILLILVAFLLYFSPNNKKLSILIILSSILFYTQFKTTNVESLVLLSNDEQRIQSTRLVFYPSDSRFVRVLFYRLNLRNLLEGDFNTISTRLQRNFFESIDPNVYFFGGFPRQRVWADDFEKFPFILLLPFFIGIYQFIDKRNFLVFLYIAVSLILLSLIGHKNNLGPFILFPPLVIFIVEGLNFLVQLILSKFKKYQKIILISLFILFILNLIQTISYAQ